MEFENNILLILITFLVTLGISILSGISGGGGGFIMTPYLIFIGMSPAQAIATGKFGAIGSTVGSLTAFKGKGLIHKKIIIPLVIITVIVSVIAALLIPHINSTLFQIVIGALLILMIPTLFLKFKPAHYSTVGKKHIGVLYSIYTLIAFLQAALASGIATFINLLFIYGFGLRPLEANATKRGVQAIQAVLVGFITALQGLVFIWYAVAAVVGSSIGSFIGSKLAIKGGDTTVKFGLAIFMLGSGIYLIITSI